MDHEPVRHYVVLRDNEEARNAFYLGVEAVLEYIRDRAFHGQSLIDLPFQIAALPSNEVGRAVASLSVKADDADGDGGDREPRDAIQGLQDLVAALTVLDEATVERIEAAVEKFPEVFSGSSPDLPFALADHWCSGEAADPIFATRAAAERLHGLDYLKQQYGTTGQGVNVVIVDQGLDQSRLGSNYAGGWPVGGKTPGSTDSPEPGSLRPTHGMMIARNILRAAPDVALFDLPLVPERISDIPVFLSLADAAFRKMLTSIAVYQSGSRPGPWILVNPWGIFDTRTDPRGRYTNNPRNPFNRLVAAAVNQGIDVVFAAGNCGQFCPSNRCGPTDHGPGRSIWGANSLAEVVTVGAVRADTMWLGYSSQGPGQPRLAREKPDLCAASQFCEDDDAFSVNTGTSAACGVAAGIIAALRSDPKFTALAPAEMKALLIKTTRKTMGKRWNERLGHGILNARAAYEYVAEPVA